MDETLARPDFALVADGLTLAAQHVRRCITLPAVDMEPVANQMAAIIQRQVDFEAEMRNNIAQGFVAVNEKVRILTRNFAARQNNSVLGETQPLEPLCSYITGLPIPGFPEHLAALDLLSSNDLNVILVELQENTEGRLSVRRKRLQKAVGMVMRHR
ncbi:hypothetical protein E4U11_008144 [Claviceps purpurea]|nr:hypothetical protein E4U11_008144 [Claviceps purpurea]